MNASLNQLYVVKPRIEYLGYDSTTYEYGDM